MTLSTSSRFGAVALLLAIAGCMPARDQTPITADATARADCRQQMNRQYNAQNRVDLTRRDERDFAYAGSYNTGISSRGLGAEYGRDQMLDGCLRAAGQAPTANPGVGPAFSPAAIGSNASSLQP